MIIQGIPICSGYAIQKVYKWEGPHYNIFATRADSIEKEEIRLKNALSSVRTDLTLLRNRTEIEIDHEHAKIIDTHLQILDDPEVYQLTISAMRSNQLCAEKNYLDITEKFAVQLESVDNEYLRERVSDIRDVCTRVLSYLIKSPLTIPMDTLDEVIIIARDLPPSIIATLDKNRVSGIVTEVGGKTSHSAIMIRSLSIPGIFGVRNIFESVTDGDIIIIDGVLGLAILNPTENEVEKYRRKLIEWIASVNSKKQFNKKKTTTLDLHKIEIAANILTPFDIDEAKKEYAEGIGLYRTEFLFMKDQYLPSEEEQFLSYKSALLAFPNQKVVIRTLDVGADKEIVSIPFEKETNPFLGYRSTRFMLNETKLFKTQIRALLRASVFGNLCVLFPMISNLEELLKVKELLSEVHKELINNQIEIAPYQIGMMIEVPSAALMADKLAKEVDFFSIGTNDLIQYTFAADRMNQNVSYLYEPCHPAIIRLIKHVIDSAHKKNKWVGVCGEIAGDEFASLFLLGLGADELSMAPSRISKIREKFSKIDFKTLSEITSTLQDEESCQAVCEKLQNIVL